MTKNNSSQPSTAMQCCVDYCETSFTGSGGTVINTYACNQSSLTSGDIWQIQKNGKSAAGVTSLPAMIVH